MIQGTAWCLLRPSREISTVVIDSIGASSLVPQLPGLGWASILSRSGDKQHAPGVARLSMPACLSPPGSTGSASRTVIPPCRRWLSMLWRRSWLRWHGRTRKKRPCSKGSGGWITRRVLGSGALRRRTDRLGRPVPCQRPGLAFELSRHMPPVPALVSVCLSPACQGGARDLAAVA